MTRSAKHKPNFEPAAAWYSCRPEYSDQLFALLADRGIPASSGVTLDLACGPGVLALEMAGRGASVVGVDCSPRMLEEAHRLTPPNVDLEWMLARAERLPFESDHFAAASCGHAFHWFDLDGALEVKRVLAPGAPLGLTWQFAAVDSPIHQAADDVVLRRAGRTTRPNYRVREPERLSEAGFKDVFRKELIKDVPWTVERYVGYMLSRAWTYWLLAGDMTGLEDDLRVALRPFADADQFTEPWCETVIIARAD